jgi:hypothetical protein
MPLLAAMTCLPNSVHYWYDLLLGQPNNTSAAQSSDRFLQGVTNRYRLSWLTNSSLASLNAGSVCLGQCVLVQMYTQNVCIYARQDI